MKSSPAVNVSTEQIVYYPRTREDGKKYIDFITQSKQQNYSETKDLPTILIFDTEFIVDVLNGEFREVGLATNTLSIDRMIDIGFGYKCSFDLNTKTYPQPSFELDSDPNHISVLIPYFAELDPIRTAKKYGLKVEDVLFKRDFELNIIPGSNLDRRWNNKELPIIDIDGIIRILDLQSHLLHNADFSNLKYTSLYDIESYYSKIDKEYLFPFNFKNQQIEKINLYDLEELPGDTRLVALPHFSQIDPVGWNLHLGFAPDHGIYDDHDIKFHHKAEILHWHQTNIPNIIEKNLQKGKKR